VGDFKPQKHSDQKEEPRENDARGLPHLALLFCMRKTTERDADGTVSFGTLESELFRLRCFTRPSRHTRKLKRDLRP
jgi:hypothetical protein